MQSGYISVKAYKLLHYQYADSNWHLKTL